MALCSKCNTETGDAKFCPSCGAMQEVSQPAPEVTTAQPVVEPAPIPAPQPEVFVPTTPAPEVVYSAPEPAVNTATASMPFVEYPATQGPMIFSIVNIALGAILCCCGYASFISLIMGIIALVMVNGSKKAASASEAEEKLKTAKIMNIIGVVFLAIGFILAIILFSAGFLQGILNELY